MWFHIEGLWQEFGRAKSIENIKHTSEMQKRWHNSQDDMANDMATIEHMANGVAHPRWHVYLSKYEK